MTDHDELRRHKIHDPRKSLDDGIHPEIVWDDWCSADPLSQVCVLFDEIDRLRVERNAAMAVYDERDAECTTLARALDEALAKVKAVAVDLVNETVIGNVNVPTRNEAAIHRCVSRLLRVIDASGRRVPELEKANEISD